MKKVLLFFTGALLLACGAVLAAAQEAKPAGPADNTPAGMYRLDFVVKELDGMKLINTRSYSMLIQTPTAHSPRTSAEVKAGTKVPVSIGGKDGQPQIQYTDVGIDIAASLAFREDGPPVLSFNTEISSLAMPEQGAQAPAQPIIRTANSRGTGVLVAGKPIVISSVDDPASNRRFTVEVTPTKLM